MTSSGPIKVSPKNFTRAESDLYFGNIVSDGGFGRYSHHRDFGPIDNQLVVRQNRDTLYSAAVFDLDAGPVTITLPNAGARFMSLQVISEDQFVPQVIYTAGLHTFTRDGVGTRYVALPVRILVDPTDEADLAAAHRLQDAIEVEQSSAGAFEVPMWDQVSQKQVRDALISLAATLPDTREMFGSRDDTDPVLRLIGSASAWGGNPEQDALYLNVVVPMNDAGTVYRLTVGDVPVDGFWSITVYNAQGYFTPNPQNMYCVNDVTAVREPDGAAVIQFGGWDGQTPNCLPVTPGWNYMVRLYRPRPEILDGSWTLPEAQPVG